MYFSLASVAISKVLTKSFFWNCDVNLFGQKLNCNNIQMAKLDASELAGAWLICDIQIFKEVLAFFTSKMVGLSRSCQSIIAITCYIPFVQVIMVVGVSYPT